jgi:5-methylcytosine-specific restriction endonuclease McrA
MSSWSGRKVTRLRKQALAQLRDGVDLCPFCRKPMRSWQRLDLDHAVPRMYGGGDETLRLAHAHCNRAAGARLVNFRRGALRRAGQPRPRAATTQASRQARW